MYPFLRFFYNQYKSKRKPKLNHIFEESTLNMTVWPTDIDLFMELNNGRYLTLMDMGRFDIGHRIDLFKIMKKRKWSLMVGAVSGRFRRRLKPFQRFTLHTQLIHFDHRWFYFKQSFIAKGKIHASFLVRTALVSKDGLVPTEDVVQALNLDTEWIAENNHKNDWLESWLVSDEIHKEMMENMQI
ncbi:MAG: acyl-CoA thioesterase [Weeksellaceae bacterium]